MADTRSSGGVPAEVDAVVVGAGFAGLYLIHRLRGAGRSVVAFEAADDVGGTWYWNRYPGARCDVPSTDYSFSFDPELEEEWHWSEKFATQPEILRYLQHVADRYDLRRDIRFSTKVTAAHWDESARRWSVATDRGDRLSCRHLVMATGCLSVPKELDIAGADRFIGATYATNRWPHEGVDFTGLRVGVIGTGSSAIQSIPIIAAQAAQLTVFQRTANYTFPAHNGPPNPQTLARLEADRAAYRDIARHSRSGVPGRELLATTLMGETATAEERQARFDWAWDRGELFAVTSMFADVAINPRSNDVAAELYRQRVRQIVEDPATADALCPRGHYLGTKRPCLDTNYLATYNLPHVRLVDLRRNPITAVTERGIDTADETFEFDAIVFATGFDAMTGALLAVDLRGRGGTTLQEKWEDGPATYLGLMTSGFPNLFTITGPGSPSVLCNMSMAIEQHVDWVMDCMGWMAGNGLEAVDPTPTAETGWTDHVRSLADLTLLPTANSWYMGANVPGKPRMFYVYTGGLDQYRLACDEVAAREYLGFRFDGPGGTVCHDGVVRTGVGSTSYPGLSATGAAASR